MFIGPILVLTISSLLNANISWLRHRYAVPYCSWEDRICSVYAERLNPSRTQITATESRLALSVVCEQIFTVFLEHKTVKLLALCQETLKQAIH